MSAEITHQRDQDGRMRQIVSAERLTEILIRDGDTLDKPDDFGPGDEWFVADPPRRRPRQRRW